MKKRGFALAELLVTIAVITLLMLILLPVLQRVKHNRLRAACANNLSQIVRAMLTYDGGYDDEFPRAGGPDSRWTGRTPNWQAPLRADAFGLEYGPGEATISASLYLLVKYRECPTEIFVCPADTATTPFEFDFAQHPISPNLGLRHLWDFGPDPSQHVSYTYHMPYGPYPPNASVGPGLAVAADRNPWLDSPSYSARPPSDLAAFEPNGAGKTLKHANSLIHQQDGQNVLFMDGHVAFETTAACGLKNDNIYTSHNGPDIQRGTPPTLESQPADPNDSLLVHDPPIASSK